MRVAVGCMQSTRVALSNMLLTTPFSWPCSGHSFLLQHPLGLQPIPAVPRRTGTVRTCVSIARAQSPE
jgi:hypothetical protein